MIMAVISLMSKLNIRLNRHTS